MKRKVLFFLSMLLGLVFVFSVNASADVGPKPYVEVSIHGVKGKKVYVTLLSKFDSTGPDRVWDGTKEPKYGGEPEIWKRFAEYKDEDGFFFLQRFRSCPEGESFVWNYRPPHIFKVLVYEPETERFSVSEIKRLYGLSNVYKATWREDGSFEVRVDKMTEKALRTFFMRLLATLFIEIVIAILFGLRGKKAITVILGMNIVTQIALNSVPLFYYDRFYRADPFIVLLVLEFLILIAEAFSYCFLLHEKENGRRTRGRLLTYAIVANLASFVSGAIITFFYPTVF